MGTRLRAITLVSVALLSCGGPNHEADGGADSGVDAGADLGRDAFTRRDGGSERDGGSDAFSADDGGPGAGWELLPGAPCDFYRAIDPATSYDFEFEACPGDIDGCQLQVLDPRYPDIVLMGARAGVRPETAPVLAMVERTTGAEYLSVAAAVETGSRFTTVAAYRYPTRLGPSCRFTAWGTDGVNGTFTVSARSGSNRTAWLVHEPLGELAAVSESFVDLTEEEFPSVATFVAPAISDTVFASPIGAGVLLAATVDGVSKWGTVADPFDTRPGDTVGVVGDRLFFVDGRRTIQTAVDWDAEPVDLYDPADVEASVLELKVNRDWVVWLEMKPDGSSLWAAPYATDAASFAPMLLATGLEFNAVGLGHGIAVLRQTAPERLVTYDLGDGRRRTFLAPDGWGFSNDPMWVGERELFWRTVPLAPPGGLRAVRLDLGSVPYD